MHGGAPPARHCGDKTLSLSPKTHLRKGAAQRAAASHDHDTTPPPLSRPRPPTSAAHRRPLQRRDRRAAPDHRPRAGRTGAAHLPRRTLEAPHQTGRLRGCRRGGARLDGARAARNGDARGHRGRHARARCCGTRCRHRPAVAGGPHRLEPLRRAGGCRRTAGTRHPRAGEEPREPRHRPLGRRHRAAAQRRHRTAGGRPPGLRRRRPRRLPQSAAVGHPHRAAPPHALAAAALRPEPYRRTARAGRSAGPPGDGAGLRRGDGRGALRPRTGVERRRAAAHPRRAEGARGASGAAPRCRRGRRAGRDAPRD